MHIYILYNICIYIYIYIYNYYYYYYYYYIDLYLKTQICMLVGTKPIGVAVY